LAGISITHEAGQLKLQTDWGRVANGIYLYPDADDALLFHGYLGSWRPFIFHCSATGKIDGLLLDFHHALQRRPLTDRLKYRLRHIIGWGFAIMLLLFLLQQGLRAARR
jgi:hypothetical protein